MSRFHTWLISARNLSSLPGLLTSLCLPIHSPPDVLRGATCIDISIEDLFQDVVRFGRLGNGGSYAFVVNRAGVTLAHPMLTEPEHIDEHPVALHIDVLERDREMEDAMKLMKRYTKEIEDLLY